MTLKPVEFLKKHPPYNVGETAGFSPEAAAALEKAGVVKPVEEKPAQSAPTKPPTA